MEFDRIEKEFQYSRECMGLITESELFDVDELTNSKEEQTVSR